MEEKFANTREFFESDHAAKAFARFAASDPHCKGHLAAIEDLRIKVARDDIPTDLRIEFSKSLNAMEGELAAARQAAEKAQRIFEFFEPLATKTQEHPWPIPIAQDAFKLFTAGDFAGAYAKLSRNDMEFTAQTQCH